MVEYKTTNVYVVKDDEKALISEDAIKILSVPLPTTSPDDIWSDYKEDYKSDSTHKSALKNGITAGFMAILEREMKNGHTHIAIGDYKFKYNEGNSMVYRSKYNPSAGGGSRGSKPKQTYFIAELAYDTVEELNKRFEKENFQLPYGAKVDENGKVLVFRSKSAQNLESASSSSPSISS